MSETHPASQLIRLMPIFLMCAILACVVTFDLFTHPDRSITFDGRVHITTISMYHDLLAHHQFPIVWVDNWGNYGYPLGLVSHQVTSYVGGLLQFVVGSPVMAYNSLFWLATGGSAVLMYGWLRGHVREPSAIVATVIFIFAPYHIQNIYTRGALPEYVSAVFLLLILLGVQRVLLRQQAIGFVLVVVGTALLVLTHPMMLVTGALLVVPYTLLIWYKEKRSIKTLIFLGISSLIGLSLAGYYVLPLLVEIKYFYYGVGDKLRATEFLSVQQLLSPFVPYFGTSHPGPPGEALRLGTIEAFGVGLALITVCLQPLRRVRFLVSILVVTLVLALLSTPYTLPLFTHVTFFNNLQYPWRVLSATTVVVPLLIAILFDTYGNEILFFITILCVLVTRVPQLYGKDYVMTPMREYQFTVTNLHTKNMAPIWAGESAEYAVHREKVAILEGAGSISNIELRNDARQYEIRATTPVHMIDYTFYFPGWKAYVDGTEIPIEFQDIMHRGVITYIVPAGSHQVSLHFATTRIRKVGGVVTALSLIGFFGWLGVLYTDQMRRFHQTPQRQSHKRDASGK